MTYANGECGRVLVLAGCFLVLLGGCSSKEVAIPLTETASDVLQLPPEQAVNILAARGDLDELKKLIEAVPDLVNARGDRNSTPLHNAAANGHADAVKFLLEHGADRSALDDDAYTAADVARDMGQDRIEKYIDNYQ